MRIPHILGNWKMHKTRAETRTTLEAFHKALQGYSGPVRFGFAPPFTALETALQVRTELRASFLLGAQNLYPAEKGAFTGEISPVMLQDLAVDFVILGHSERRHLFGETNEFVARKVRAALDHGLTPVVCVGETLEERQGGRALEVVEQQVRASLQGLSPEDLQRVLIAYEPVWAIGTGHTATPEQAQEMHAHVRRILAEMGARAEEIPILYGGSVKPENIAGLSEQPDIDGALVGGASLKADSFAAIIKRARFSGA